MKKPFKVAGIAGILLTILLIASFILSIVGSFIQISNSVEPSFEIDLELLFSDFFIPFHILELIGLILSIFLAYGFLILSKKQNSDLLYWASILLIASSIISIMIFSYFIYLGDAGITVSFIDSSYVYYSNLITQIIFGIGLIKLSKNVRLSKSTGIVTVITSIHPGLLIFSLIMRVILMFKASNDFENGKKNRKRKSSRKT